MSLLPDRYRADNLRFVLRHPRALSSELHALGNGLNRAIHRQRYDGVGTDVTAEDWDNLLVLDACRFDVYESRTRIDGDLQTRTSRGSESWEFLRENFGGGHHYDTVYVSANPHAYKLPDDTFHATWNLLEDHWDPELETVLPEAVADAAREALSEFPNKRLIVHFMQPHFPFIGERGRELDSGGIRYHIDEGFAESDGRPAEADRRDGTRDHASAGGDGRDMMIWGRLRLGLADVESVWEAYCENLDVVLPVVEQLLADLDGRSVVTSDHGNLFGERLWPIPSRAYGHPPGIFAEPLRRVPWHVVPGQARTTSADPSVEGRSIGDDLARARLRDLGYVE